MRLIVILLSTLLLFSCEPANFWQKADIAKKDQRRELEKEFKVKNLY